MAEPSPISDEDLFNVIVLGGVTSPGVIRSMTGHDRKINWDVKNGQGQKGASTTLKDIPPLEVSITWYLATEEEIDAWPAWRTHVNSTISGATPKALDVYQPDLHANGIGSFVLASMGAPVHDGKGGQTITIKFQEYKPPKPKGGSPSGSKANPKADPNAAANAELARLTAQYAATPWG